MHDAEGDGASQTVIETYPLVRHAHLALVALSVGLFALRGAGVLAQARWPMRVPLRVGAVVIDTLLATAGVLLWIMLGLNPLRDTWLGAKLVLLVVYVMLGTWALKRARTTAGRLGCYLAALVCVGTMVSVAITRHPLGGWARVVPAS